MTVQGGIVEYASPGDHLTMTPGAAITGGNVVKLSANRTVIITAATGETNVIGVALFNVAATDTAVTCATDGVWPLVASGAIAAGDFLVGAAAGLAITAPAVAATAAATATTQTDIINTRAKLGKALEAIANAAAGRVKLML